MTSLTARKRRCYAVMVPVSASAARTGNAREYTLCPLQNYDERSTLTVRA